MANVNTVNFQSPQSMIAPDIAAQQMQLQRRQQLADYLRQQAIAPIDQQTVTGAGPARVVPVSPLQGLAKLGQAYFGKQMQDKNDAQQLDLGKQYMGRLADVLRGGNGNGPGDWVNQAPGSSGAPGQGAMPGQLGSGMTGDVAPPAVGTPQIDLSDSSAPPVQNTAPAIPQGGPMPTVSSTPAGQPDRFALANILRSSAIGSLGGDKAAEAYWKQSEPTPEMKNNAWMGYSPQQALAAKTASDLKAAEIERKGGNQFYNYLTQQAGFAPKLPENSMPAGPIAPDGSMPKGVVPVPGASAITQNNAYSSALGAAGAKPATKIGPNNTVLSTNEADLATGGQSQPGAMPKSGPANFPKADTQWNEAQFAKAAQGILDNPESSPADKADAKQWFSQHPNYNKSPTYVPKLPEGTDQVVQGYVTRHNQVVGLASTASQDIDALNKIAQIARETKTGPGQASSQVWKQYINLVPGVRLDMKDADNMAALKKYVASMSDQGLSVGTGSDAQLKNRIDSLPNDGVPNGAIINELVPYLVAQRKAIAARAAVGQQALISSNNNPAVLADVEQKWRQNYDPRIFQLQDMPAPQQQAFVKNLSPTEAKALLQKRATLKGMGAF